MPATVRIDYNDFAEKGAHKGIVYAMTEVLTRIVAEAKQLCPVDYGQLANSLMYKINRKEGGFNDSKRRPNRAGNEKAPEAEKLSIRTKGSIAGNDSEFTGVAGTNSDHWYPEFGTRYQQAQPFLRPARAKAVDGQKAADIGKVYGRKAMEEEFRKRRKKSRVIKNG